jgi:hypothetical protein
MPVNMSESFARESLHRESSGHRQETSMPDRKKILFNDPHANSNSFLMNERLNDPLAYRNNISQQNQEWKPIPPVDAIHQGQYIEPRLSPAKIAVHHYPTHSQIADGDNIRNSFSKQLLSGGIHA